MTTRNSSKTRLRDNKWLFGFGGFILGILFSVGIILATMFTLLSGMDGIVQNMEIDVDERKAAAGLAAGILEGSNMHPTKWCLEIWNGTIDEEGYCAPKDDDNGV